MIRVSLFSVTERGKKQRPGLEIVGDRALIKAELTALFIQLKQDPAMNGLLDEAEHLSTDHEVLAAYRHLIDTDDCEEAGKA